MKTKHHPTDGILTAVVLLHLLVTVLHGRAHVGAAVPATTSSNIFILTVIVAAPLVGAVVLWFFSIRAGAWLLGLSLAGALMFGVINHFVLESPDHVTHIVAHWRALFTVTAVLLAVTEALGSGLAFWRAGNARLQ